MRVCMGCLCVRARCVFSMFVLMFVCPRGQDCVDVDTMTKETLKVSAYEGIHRSVRALSTHSGYTECSRGVL